MFPEGSIRKKSSISGVLVSVSDISGQYVGVSVDVFISAFMILGLPIGIFCDLSYYINSPGDYRACV